MEYQIPAEQWAQREAAADRLAEAAVAFLDVSAGEAAWWHITGGWPHSIVAGSDVTNCREWLVVRAAPRRIAAFYDAVTGRDIVSSVHFGDSRASFVPAG